MRFNNYIVYFETGKTVYVSSVSNPTEATILAQATMIREGLAYEVKSVMKVCALNHKETDYVAE